MKKRVKGWLFDVYPSHSGMCVWIIDGEGEKHRCYSEFRPSFFLHLNESDSKRAIVIGRGFDPALVFSKQSQKELFSGDDLDVLKVTVKNPRHFKKTVRHFETFFPHFSFYNSDLMPEQLFFYDTQLFPLAYGEYLIDGTKLLDWNIQDSRDACEYTLPPLSVMYMRNANDFVPPKYQSSVLLEISYDNRTYLLQQETPVEILEALNWHLHRFDPDILLTDYGDSVLLPTITSLAHRYRVPLLLNRDPDANYVTSTGSSFYQYGKVVHKDGVFELAGRWHIDAHNSFTLTEAELDGLFELARLTQIPVQRQARASIGTGMSSLQLSWAYRNNILIPAKKREAEEFKSAATLLLADRGGLLYQPPAGYHEDIAELDFASMYPSIMVNQNVSPETVNCTCCRNHKVPELEYTICEKREGIIGATLRSVIARRSYYKKRKKELRGKDELLSRTYDRRQNALKWMLVSCFGYLGYKNARFGKIEAHESVNAFSRECILQAKEIAESQGFTLIHAIIDCMWLKKEGATERDYELLCEEITNNVGIEISLEGIYSWILFPLSKMDPAISTHTRYAGRYNHGEVKIRGIEIRRHDTPTLIKDMQREMLERMGRASRVDELTLMTPELLDIVRKYTGAVQSGKANPLDLVIKRRITKEPEEYVNNSISAVVAKMVEQMGVHLSPGESIEFIIIDQSGKKTPEKAKPLALYAYEDGYDAEKYTELLLKAAETLLSPLGYDYDTLSRMFSGIPKKAKTGTLKEKIQTTDFTFECIE